MTASTSDTLNLSIERIGVHDYKLVINLFNAYRVFYKQDSDLTLAENFIKQRIINNESVIFVAMDGITPVGFTQLYPTYSSAKAVKNWILNDLYVDGKYRKHGIGRKLIMMAMDFARNNGAKYVQLETANDNYNAQHLYESTGFLRHTPGNEFIIYRKNVD